MSRVSLAEAKARFEEFVERAQAGELIEIFHLGEPVARLTPAMTPRKPIDMAALRALTRDAPAQSADAAKPIRSLRDSDRF